MLVVRTAIPAPALRPYVKCFGEHAARIDGSLLIPLPARTDQFLMFFFGDLYHVGRQGLYVPVPSCRTCGGALRQRLQLKAVSNPCGRRNVGSVQITAG